MKILVTNDDGVFAPGINALVKELEKEHNVIVVAPDNQRSASGHSITIGRPLLVKEVKLEKCRSTAYAVDGTPADCVRIAIDKLTGGNIDVVISGINNGYNLGTDVLYSGTISAAIEASIYKLPAIAFSQFASNNIEDFQESAKFAMQIINKILAQNIEGNTVFSVNLPEECIGIKVCKIGARAYTNNYVAIEQQEEGVLYELRDELINTRSEDTDTEYIEKGYITITPLQYDLTNFQLIHQISKWF